MHPLVSPYYDSGGITIYHGDCRQIMPGLGTFDLLLSDPPYGIGESVKAHKRATDGVKRPGGPPRFFEAGDWDNKPVPQWVLSLALDITRWQIVFGGNYYAMPPSKCWLVWDKENGETDFADCELAWTNLDKAVRRIRHQWNGMLRKGKEPRWHPTQKPLDVIAWALRQAPDDVATVIDPWMGSGTSLRAAKDAGKRAVGIELDERHCETAAERLSQEVLLFG